jgi:O-antigen/teichoic acid export membrane protein
MKGQSSFIKDLFSVMTSRIMVIVFGLITSVVTARYLGPEGNGIIAALTVYPSLFMTIGSLGIRQSTTYFVGQNKFELNEIYGSILSICLFTSCVCVVSSFWLIHTFTNVEYTLILLLLTIFPIPFSLFNTYSSGIFLGQQKIKEFNKIDWLPSLIVLAMTLLLVVGFGLGISGAMVASFSGVAILSFFVFAKMKKMIPVKLSFNFKLIKSMLSLGITYAIALLIINLNYKADLVLLGNLSDSFEIGIYTKGAAIIQYLWQIPMLLSTLIFSRSAGAKDAYKFSLKACSLLRFSGMFLLLISVLLYFFSEYIILFLYGNQFEKSTSVLKILMPGVVLLTIFKVLNMDLAGKGKPWVAIKAMGPAVIINIILNYFWIPLYGSIGAAYASTISYSVAAIIFLFVYSNETKVPVYSIFRFASEDKTLVLNFIGKFKTKFGLKSL